MLYYGVTHLYVNWEPHYFSQCMFGRTFYAKKSLFIYDMYVHTAYESNSNSKKGNCSEGGEGGVRYNWFAAAVSITTWDIAAEYVARCTSCVLAQQLDR